MGILNATSDSFANEGVAAIAALGAHITDGAVILDVGGESTRPGAVKVPAEAEQAHVLPLIVALAWLSATISIDTGHASTMAAALDAGRRW